ncbi:NAD(P)H-binding protein [Streptomyces sp. NA04227]|uniref:SDR family oxidoreductase n=1 Tax=Streptomyces sp. NA04227 TaxID=2742136 RepID=UPI00158FF0D4|nr:NAD(P)H-binding protein [Streptomyces sp. NA04227]QKW05457.1 NAD(P)H-binding protein [Streptomyces sp. NA04227]
MSTILVTGGTGTLGSKVAAKLAQQGHDVRVLSRHSEPYAVDLREGTGLDRAVDGCEAIVHCASTPRGGDEEAAGNLVETAQRYRVPHLVYISIVGIDRVPMGYYRSKLAAEKRIENSELDWTILRATQFHELALMVLEGLARLPVMLLPKGVHDQPVEVTEVADRLAELATGAPAGRVPELGGPEILSFEEMATAYLRASGRRRRTVSVPLAGRTYAAVRAGGLLTPERAVGKGTFEEFLARRFPA